MRIASWIPKFTNAHSEYVMLIAFPLQQWLQEHASCLVVTETGRLMRGTNWVFILYFSLIAVFEYTACSGGRGWGWEEGIFVKLLSVLHSSE